MSPTYSTIRGDAVRLEADRDAACVHYPISSLQPSVPYSGDRWTLTVTSDGKPFLLALPDTANDGWVLDGVPAGVTVDPTVIDGYRQAWLITGLNGDATLVARCRPADEARLAQWASIAVVGAVLLPWRRRRRPCTSRVSSA